MLREICFSSYMLVGIQYSLFKQNNNKSINMIEIYRCKISVKLCFELLSIKFCFCSYIWFAWFNIYGSYNHKFRKRIQLNVRPS